MTGLQLSKLQPECQRNLGLDRVYLVSFGH